MADPITDPTYRYATQRYDLDGSTIDFYFNFSDGYISTDYIRAYYYNTISLVTTEIDRSLIEFVGVGQVRIPDAALQPVTNKLILKRWTEKEYPLCDFTDDSLINEANLDKNARQAVHDIAEMIDYLADLNEKWESLNKTVLELLQIINDKLAILEDLIALLENLKFTDLKDTPNSLVAGGIPQVNHAGTALVWRTAAEIVSEGGGGVITFTGLTDTPNSYTGQNNKIVSVSGSSLVFKTVAQAVADEGVSFGIPEAPVDTKLYGRKDGAWSEVVIPTPPIIDKQGQFVLSYIGSLNTAATVCSFVATKAINVLSAKCYLGISPEDQVVVGVFKNNTLVHSQTLTASGATNIAVTTSIAVDDLIEMRITTPDTLAQNVSITYLFEK